MTRESAPQIDLSDEERAALREGYCRRLIKARFYQWARDQAKGKRIHWASVAAALYDHTGVAIPHDTLRQNLEPASKKKGKGPRDFKDPARWAALYRFLIDDATGYLHPSELTRELRPLSGLLALQSFFSPGKEQPLPNQLTGRFSNLWDVQSDLASEWTLDLDQPLAAGLMRAELREEIEDERDSTLSYTRAYAGAMIGRGSYLEIVLRDRITGAPKSLLLAQVDPPLSAQTPIQHLAVWRFDGLDDCALSAEVVTHGAGDASDQSVDHITYGFDGAMPCFS